MGTRFRFLPGVLMAILLLGLSGCNVIGGSSSPSGTGFLYVSTQGDSLVTPYSIDLTTGLITTNGSAVSTHGTPSAMLLDPSGSNLYIANRSTNDISTYTVKADGTLTAGSSNLPTGMTPLNMAMDAAGHFLFVA